MSETMFEDPHFREKALLAILMFLVRSRPINDDSNDDPAETPEALLGIAGFRNAEIVKITGTPKSTVSYRLKAAGLV